MASANLNNIIQVALGGILTIVALVLMVTVLPTLDAAVSSYALGPDGISDEVGTPGSTDDDPPSGNVQLLETAPLTLIAGAVVLGVAFMVSGFRGIRGSG